MSSKHISSCIKKKETLCFKGRHWTLRVMTSETQQNDLETCTICIDDFTHQELVKFRNCQHGLCAPCHAEYLLTSNKCPVCRSLIQDPTELFLEELNRLSVSLARTNKALRRIHTAGVISIIPSSDTAKQLTDVQGKLQQLNMLMAETGIAYVGRQTQPQPQRFATPNTRQYNTTSTTWGGAGGSGGNDETLQVDMNFIAMALASAGITPSTSNPEPSTRRMPTTSTYTTDIYVGGFTPASPHVTSTPNPSHTPHQSASTNTPAPETRTTTRRRAPPRTTDVAAAVPRTARQRAPRRPPATNGE